MFPLMNQEHFIYCINVPLALQTSCAIIMLQSNSFLLYTALLLGADTVLMSPCIRVLSSTSGAISYKIFPRGKIEIYQVF